MDSFYDLLYENSDRMPAVNRLTSGLFAQSSRTHLLLVVFIVLNISIGALTFHDYGVSFDEPGIYSFAHESVQAYSKFLQPVEYTDPRSNFDLRYYGPFYFIFVDLLSEGLSAIGFQIPMPDVWHLVYFLTFQAGLIIFYLLARRWLSDWAALGATVLLGSQPLLWGHAFINPKDIPFMVFFLACVYAGLKMVDQLAAADPFIPLSGSFSNWAHSSRLTWVKLAVSYRRKAKQQVGTVLLLTLILIFATPIWKNLLSSLVRLVLAGKPPLFPIENYVHKALIWLSWLELVVVFLLILLAFWLFLRQIPDAVQTLNRLLKQASGYLFSVMLNPYVICAGILLGLCTSIRFLGALAGVLVVLFLLYRLRMRAWLPLILYGCLAVLIIYVTWPFLWEHPVRRFLESLNMMSSFPIKIDVLFGGQYYFADHLPRRYLPVLMSIQFTEPAVLLSLVGSAIVFLQYKRIIKTDLLLVLVVWLLFPLGLIILGQRTIYDNFRHLLFLVPPLFLLAGFAIDSLFQAMRASLLRVVVITVFGLSGWMAMLQLHPYEYVYYNWFAGGLRGASGQYTLDYWVTSFRVDAGYLNLAAPEHARVAVCGPANVLRYDLRPDLLIIEDCSGLQNSTDEYDYAVLQNRYGEQSLYPNAPILYRAEKQGVTFSVVKSTGSLEPAQKP